jgi:hypothetical protein
VNRPWVSLIVSGAHEDAVRRLFTLRLAQVPPTGDPLRRARRSECTPAEWHLAETLADQDWRLLSLARADDDEPTAEVAHDQLLRSWPRLAGWLEEEHEFLVWRSQAKGAAEERDGDLLSGRRPAARSWFERRAKDIAPALRGFIKTSIAADGRRIAAERRRRRTIFTATASGLVVALGLAGWQWRVAEAQKKEAQAQPTRSAEPRPGDATANGLGRTSGCARAAAPRARPWRGHRRYRRGW